MSKIKVTVWNEFVHEQEMEKVRAIYPDGIHGAIKEGLDLEGDFEVRTATLDMPEHGLTEEVLNDTDVLIWWGHCAHKRVEDAIADRVVDRVLNHGMGLIVLHSGHLSKPFVKLLGTTCRLKWRENRERELIWTIDYAHPIAQGLPEVMNIPEEETYGEPFGIPTPDELVFVSWFAGGNVFRSGACWHRGKGKIFYFRPGHETYPIFHRPDVRRVIANAAHWAKPVDTPKLGIEWFPPVLEDYPVHPGPSDRHYNAWKERNPGRER